jgi:hypothetical protein
VEFWTLVERALYQVREYDQILLMNIMSISFFDITNGHFIHAGPLEGIRVSIYLYLIQEILLHLTLMWDFLFDLIYLLAIFIL